MELDYKKIREDKREDYGRKVGDYGRKLLPNLYADPAHFVLELLQNAEDSIKNRGQEWNGSRAVSFHLTKDELRFEHSGRPFNEADVRGICEIGESSKADDDIGHFGIGFKSVYKITDRPEIHSGPEDFAIEDFVLPEAIPAIEKDADDTVFLFPLKTGDEYPYDAIAKGLRELGASTLLFLRHIAEIKWSIDYKCNGHYSRKFETVADGVRRVTLVGQEDVSEEWLVFSPPVADEGKPAGHIEIAFSINTETQKVQRLNRSELVVFFPTLMKMTHIGFRMQGPYETTPSRENVLRDEPNNERLVDETSKLLVHALRWLRCSEAFTIDADVLSCLPLEQGDWPMFAPLFHATKQALKSEPLLPTVDSRYVSAGDALLAGSEELRQLFSQAQLAALYGENVAWLSGEITGDFHSYLTREFGVPVVDPVSITKRLNREFLEAQPDNWIVQLYEFLGGRPRIVENLKSRTLTTPLIRLEGGKHVGLGDGQVCLPGEVETDFPTVRRYVCTSDKAKNFLHALGLKEADLVEDIIQNVLPKYKAASPCVDDAEYEAHFARMLRAYDSASPSRPKDLRDAFQESWFVRLTDGKHVRLNETQVYLPGEVHTDLPTVHGSLCSPDGAEKFLRDMGLRVTDKVDVAIRNILRKKYQAATSNVGDADYKEDFAYILEAYKAASPSRPKDLRDAFQESWFVRLTDGKHVRLSETQVYLPGKGETDFPTVHSVLCSPDGAKKFLRDLELEEANLVEDIIENVLPKYQTETPKVDDAEYVEHFVRILRAYNSNDITNSQQENLREAFRASWFVKLSDGTHVSLTEKNDVFLPAGDPTRFPTVHNDLWCTSDEAKTFLYRELELREPDLVDDVITNVLQKYQAAATNVGDSEYEVDFARILQAYNSNDITIPRREDLKAAFRKSWFVRLTDKTHVSLNKTQVYSPGQEPTSLPTVHNALYSSDEAKEFLGAMGLEKADLVDIVIHDVLQKYQASQPNVDDSEYKSDFTRILQAYSSNDVTLSRRKELAEAFQKSWFVKLSVGTHVRLSDKTRVCLPGKVKTDLPTVHNDLWCTSDEAKTFLRRELGLREPSLVALVQDVIENVLRQKYQASQPNVDDSEYESHIRRIAHVYIETGKGAPSTTLRTNLMAELGKSSFVRAVDAGTGKTSFLTPGGVYSGRRLKRLFEGVAGVWLVDNRWKCLHSHEMQALLEECGATQIKVVEFDPKFSEEKLSDLRKGRSLSRDAKVRDYKIPVLHDLLQIHASSASEKCREKSALLWEALVEYVKRCGGGCFTGSYQFHSYSPHGVTTFPAHFVKRLNTKAWIPSKDGTLQLPKDVEFDSLGWEDNSILRKHIKFRPPTAVLDLAKQAGSDPEAIVFMLEKGITLDELKAIRPDSVDVPQASATTSGVSPPPTERHPASAPAEPFAKRLYDVQTASPSPAADNRVVLPSGGPKTRESAMRDTSRSGHVARTEGHRVRVVRYDELGPQGKALANKFYNMVTGDYSKHCQICGKTFVRTGGGWQVNVIHVVPPREDHRTIHFGDLLGLCGWHSNLLLYGQWALLDPETNQPFEAANDMKGAILNQDPDTDDSGNLFVGLPIRFYHVYRDWEAAEPEVDELIHYSKPHWEYLCELLKT